MGNQFEDYIEHYLNGARRPTSSDVTFHEGQVHNLYLYFQLYDENQLYKKVKSEYESRGYADCDRPHPIGTIRIGPDDTSVDIGLFKTYDRYGYLNEGSYEQVPVFIIGLYEDITDGNITSNPERCRIEIAPRDHDLVYKDGHKLTWPAGFKTDTTYEGSNISINTSNVSSIGDVFTRALNVLESSRLQIDFSSFFSEKIDETMRFSNLEIYHRFIQDRLRDIKSALKTTSQLIATDEGEGEVDPDHRELFGFTTDDINRLGFDTTVKSGSISKNIPGIYLKVYRRKRPERFAESDSQYHPKIEIEAKKAYPVPLFDAVKRKLEVILNAHIHDYAAIESDELVSDLYYEGSNEQKITTDSPKEYRKSLQRYHASEMFESNILKYIYRDSTDSPKDILIALSDGNARYYQQIAERTGLTKPTVGKWARRMRDDGICRIIYSEAALVELVDPAVNVVNELIEPGKTIGEIKRAMRKRKEDRIKRRESNGTSTDSESDNASVSIPARNIVCDTGLFASKTTPENIMRVHAPPP
jgi:hypothetical protein